MVKAKSGAKRPGGGLRKCPTGIQGLDEITGGGLPRGRPTLICGAAGCGKTLLAMEFLVRGVLEYDEPGVFVSFEETDRELAQNVASLGWNLKGLMDKKKLAIDHVYIERSQIEETGEYDLDGLFIRLDHAIRAVGAKRVALDTVEALFGGFTNVAILRAEMRRLFRWLKRKRVTAVITAEPGDGRLTRHGMEEYVSDCVITLGHRVEDQVATRRLRVVKYRGSNHGTNEYPFLVGERGLSVLPITSVQLTYQAPTERISTGIPRLDIMLDGKGYYRGSTVLISGTAGTGKTSFAAAFVRAACRRGERALFFSMEESPDQIMRNGRSIGIDLEPWVKRGLLRFHAGRPTAYGLEMHLVTVHRMMEDFKPRVIVMDPISNLDTVGSRVEVRSMLARMTDYMKTNRITALLTDLSDLGNGLESTTVSISSLMDTWVLLRDIESAGERNRGLYILKSRGMAHSNQIREFVLSERGIELLDVYLGPAGVLTGAARYQQVAREKADALVHRQEIESRQRQLERRRQAVEAQIAALRADFEAEEEELKRLTAQHRLREQVLGKDQDKMARMRGADRPESG